MRRLALTSCLTLAVAGGLALSAATPSAARAADRTADQILKDLKAIEAPRLEPAKRNDRAAVNEYLALREKAMNRFVALVGELYKAAPEHPELPALLPERWVMQAMTGGPEKFGALRTEVEEVRLHARSPKVRDEAAFFLARLAMTAAQGDTARMVQAADAFIKAAPKDERGALLLASVAMNSDDEKKQAELLRRVVKEFPESEVAKQIAGNLRRLEGIGKPFDLEFADAIKGTNVSTKTTLKGKVVVVDFWATWCGPCVAEMPNMKRLYARYKDQGVEFVGVSLDQPKDQGGFDALKKFVAENEVPWPQYYLGNGPESEFATAWGISSIPTIFVLDARGNLYSTDARGKLEEMIPELLKKAKAGGKVNAGSGGN